MLGVGPGVAQGPGDPPPGGHSALWRMPSHGHRCRVAIRTEVVPVEAAAQPEPDVPFGELLGQMLSVAVVLLAFTLVMSWVAAIAR